MTIAEALIKLANDPELLERAKHDFDGVLDELDLTKTQKELLRAGDLRELRIQIEIDMEGEHEAFGIRIVWGPIVWQTKRPPPPPPGDQSA